MWCKSVLSTVLCFCIVRLSLALYDSNDDVIELTPATFSQMTSGNELWLVEFYAPWCGHCQSLAPEWKKAASALKGVVKVAAVDMDKHQQLGSPYGISGFPTIKLFGSNKQSPTDYQGGRDAQSIVNEAIRVATEMVRNRMGGGGSSSGGQGQSGGSSGSDVVDLTDSNFESTVLRSDEPWLVEFYAPWCGHCKNLEPHWKNAATQLKGKIKLGAVDATVHREYAGKYGVQGFPTIKFFPAGAKSGEAQEYDGGRTTNDIVAWAQNKYTASLPPPEIKEIVSAEIVKEACETKQLCVISILPVLLDCQSECRNKYISIMKEMGERYKQKNWGWIWAEATSQPDLETSFGIGGFGYPAAVVLNQRKMKYVSLRGSFSSDGLHEFLREVSVGRGSSAPVKDDKMPKITNRDPWDGKDGKPPQEEEIDLSELGIKSEL